MNDCGNRYDRRIERLAVLTIEVRLFLKLDFDARAVLSRRGQAPQTSELADEAAGYGEAVLPPILKSAVPDPDQITLHSESA